VSYTYRPSAEFQASLGMLPSWLQEETLDELEYLLANPKKLVVRPGSNLAVHDFVRGIGGKVHYIFLSIQPDHAANLLTLVSLGHVERPQR
jgi:hypothetical protein